MSIAALKYISNFMDSINESYAFMEWKGKPPERYWIGEYQELESITKEEDGFQETSFILTGFTRGSWLSFEEAKAKIENGITKIAVLEDGSGIAIFYGSTLVVPTGDAELKRLQINLTIKEWKVNQ